MATSIFWFLRQYPFQKCIVLQISKKFPQKFKWRHKEPDYPQYPPLAPTSSTHRPVKLDEKRAFWRKKCNKAAVCFKTFIITYLISYQFCTPLSALLTPPSWKDGGQKQFFVNTFLSIYFRGKRFYINVILETIFYKICSTYFFVCCSVLMLKVHKDFRNGVHENNHGIKTMQYTQKVYRTFYVENVI